MKIPQIAPLAGMTPLGVKPKSELFEDPPFNLSGELIDNGTTAEGDLRRQAEAENIQRKSQLSLF